MSSTEITTPSPEGTTSTPSQGNASQGTISIKLNIKKTYNKFGWVYFTVNATLNFREQIKQGWFHHYDFFGDLNISGTTETFEPRTKSQVVNCFKTYKEDLSPPKLEGNDTNYYNINSNSIKEKIKTAIGQNEEKIDTMDKYNSIRNILKETQSTQEDNALKTFIKKYYVEMSLNNYIENVLEDEIKEWVKGEIDYYNKIIELENKITINTRDITTNKNNIAINATGIANNTRDINDLKLKMTGLERQIGTTANTLTTDLSVLRAVSGIVSSMVFIGEVNNGISELPERITQNITISAAPVAIPATTPTEAETPTAIPATTPTEAATTTEIPAEDATSTITPLSEDQLRQMQMGNNLTNFLNESTQTTAEAQTTAAAAQAATVEAQAATVEAQTTAAEAQTTAEVAQTAAEVAQRIAQTAAGVAQRIPEPPNLDNF